MSKVIWQPAASPSAARCLEVPAVSGQLECCGSVQENFDIIHLKSSPSHERIWAHLLLDSLGQSPRVYT